MDSLQTGTQRAEGWRTGELGVGRCGLEGEGHLGRGSAALTDLTLQWATVGRNWPEGKNQFLQGSTLPPRGVSCRNNGPLVWGGP